MARQCPKPKRKRDATWFMEKFLLVKAQGNANQAYDLDAYDSDCDEVSIAKAVLMANLSSYGSYVLSEVPVSDNTNNDMLNQSVQEMPYSEPSHFMEHPENELHSDSNKAQQIRPMLYDDNVIAKETNVISISNSEETLMLEEESRSKMLLKQSDPMILEKKVNTKPINCAELKRLSEDFGKHFVPQRELSDEQALHPVTDQSASSPVKIEAPRELPKEHIRISLKLLGMDNVSWRGRYQICRVFCEQCYSNLYLNRRRRASLGSCQL
nr:hypothetical protein [Tanacetum cinerariifolium]